MKKSKKIRRRKRKLNKQTIPTQTRKSSLPRSPLRQLKCQFQMKLLLKSIKITPNLIKPKNTRPTKRRNLNFSTNPRNRNQLLFFKSLKLSKHKSRRLSSCCLNNQRRLLLNQKYNSSHKPFKLRISLLRLISTILNQHHSLTALFKTSLISNSLNSWCLKATWGLGSSDNI